MQELFRGGEEITVWERLRNTNFYIWEKGTPHEGYYPEEPYLFWGNEPTLRYEYRHEQKEDAIKVIPDYGLTVSNIRAKKGDNMELKFEVPVIVNNNYTYFNMYSWAYLDDSPGGRTWYTNLYGIRADGSSSLLMNRIGGGIIKRDISAYAKVQIEIRLWCGSYGEGEMGPDCDGCTVGYYINEIFLSNE